MTLSIDLGAVRVVLLDIEGTATPLSFVHDVLFPLARTRLDDFFQRAAASADVAPVVEMLRDEHVVDRATAEPPPPWDDGGREADAASATAYASWLMDRDRKSPALNVVQGLIWQDGYHAGQLRGEVYDDVPLAIRRWRRMGRRVAIYSSGSELAQRLLFASTQHGDLTPLISGFFDTTVGAKREPSSYVRVASRLAVGASSMVFLSDMTAELHAARAAGCQVLLVTRPGNPPQDDAHAFEAVQDLSSLLVPGESQRG